MGSNAGIPAPWPADRFDVIWRKCETGERSVDMIELLQLARLYKRPIQSFFPEDEG
jgi:hypothetical protein